MIEAESHAALIAACERRGIALEESCRECRIFPDECIYEDPIETCPDDCPHVTLTQPLTHHELLERLEAWADSNVTSRWLYALEVVLGINSTTSTSVTIYRVLKMTEAHRILAVLAAERGVEQ